MRDRGGGLEWRVETTEVKRKRGRECWILHASRVACVERERERARESERAGTLAADF
jgi:hypothetical protein